MKKQFYMFGDAMKKGAITVQSKVKYDTLSLIEEDNILIKNNEFYMDSGKKFFDVIRFADSLNLAISEKLKKILEENKISGWKCFPIHIENQTEKYYVLQIISKAGPILNLEQVISYEAENREFDLNTWDESDIFTLENTLLFVCNEKVKELFKKNKISNIEINPL